MKEEISKVLVRYASIQANLASQSARDMIAEEICDIFVKKQNKFEIQPVTPEDLRSNDDAE